MFHKAKFTHNMPMFSILFHLKMLTLQLTKLIFVT